MTPFSTAAWDTDIEFVLTRLTRDQIKDQDYWFASVENIEAGYHPSGTGRLTMTDLEDWFQRCTTTPKDTNNADIPRQSPTSHRAFRNINPR